MTEFIQRAIDLPWGYIMGTLVIRFVGVFIVLAILMVAMQILGKVVSGLISREEARHAHKHKPKEEASTTTLVDVPERAAGEEELAAAIGAALAFAIEVERKLSPLSPSAGGAAGSWSMAGRVALMNDRLQGGAYRGSLK